MNLNKKMDDRNLDLDFIGCIVNLFFTDCVLGIKAYRGGVSLSGTTPESEYQRRLAWQHDIRELVLDFERNYGPSARISYYRQQLIDTFEWYKNEISHYNSLNNSPTSDSLESRIA